MTRLEILRLPP